MSDGLKQLLETEAELDAKLESAKQRAKEIVQAARSESEERMERHEGELRRLEDELRKELQAERDRKTESIRAEAAREADALDGLPDDEVDELARYVVSRLIGEDPGGEP
jgi:vacuolar-type H+-ATPase subunit H